MIITGRRVGAEEALQLGFVNSVVTHDKLIDVAMAKAEEISNVSPSSVKTTKRVLNDMAKLEQLPKSLAFSREVMRDLSKTEDFKEGVQAFVQKRKPKWVNR